MIHLVFLSYTIFDTVFRNNKYIVHEGRGQMVLYKNCCFDLSLTF